VSFFKIPKHCAWLDLLRLEDSTIYPSSCICSNHFKEGDISQGKKPSLKKNATALLSTLGESKNLMYCLIYNVLIFNIIQKKKSQLKMRAHHFFSSFAYHLLTTHPVCVFFSVLQ